MPSASSKSRAWSSGGAAISTVSIDSIGNRMWGVRESGRSRRLIVSDMVGARTCQPRIGLMESGCVCCGLPECDAWPANEHGAYHIVVAALKWNLWSKAGWHKLSVRLAFERLQQVVNKNKKAHSPTQCYYILNGDNKMSLLGYSSALFLYYFLWVLAMVPSNPLPFYSFSSTPFRSVPSNPPPYSGAGPRIVLSLRSGPWVYYRN